MLPLRRPGLRFAPVHRPTAGRTSKSRRPAARLPERRYGIAFPKTERPRYRTSKSDSNSRRRFPAGSRMPKRDTRSPRPWSGWVPIPGAAPSPTGRAASIWPHPGAETGPRSESSQAATSPRRRGSQQNSLRGRRRCRSGSQRPRPSRAGSWTPSTARSPGRMSNSSQAAEDGSSSARPVGRGEQHQGPVVPSGSTTRFTAAPTDLPSKPGPSPRPSLTYRPSHATPRSRRFGLS